MAFSASEYLKLLLNLFPKGRAWSRSPDGYIYKLMNGFSVEFNRVDSRSDELRKELDTRYATELLTDHEKDLGLPDECVALAQTIAERRSVAHTKFIEEGGLNSQSYIDMADDLGYQITIQEFTPAWAGMVVAGDQCGPQKNIFYVLISIQLNTDDWIYFTCGQSQCGDYLISVADTSALQCILNKLKPAHIKFLYTYLGYSFDQSFSSAFNAVPSSDDAYLAGAFDRAFGYGFDAFYGGGDFDYDSFDSSFYKPL